MHEIGVPSSFQKNQCIFSIFKYFWGLLPWLCTVLEESYACFVNDWWFPLCFWPSFLDTTGKRNRSSPQPGRQANPHRWWGQLRVAPWHESTKKINYLFKAFLNYKFYLHITWSNSREKRPQLNKLFWLFFRTFRIWPIQTNCHYRGKDYFTILHGNQRQYLRYDHYIGIV